MGRKRLAENRGFPPNLYKNAAGYFYYLDPDRKKTKGLGKDRAKAFSEARAANAALAMRAPSSLADWVSGKQDYTLAEWAPLYKALWMEKTEPVTNTLRSATNYLNQITKSDIAWMKLPAIETSHVAKFLAAVEKEKGPSTALNLRSRLGDVFRMAENQGLIDAGSNPVTATYTPDRTVKRERLSLEQFYAIRELAPLWVQRAMTLALMTSQRRDDVANMKFSDVRNGFLYIAQGKGGGMVKLQQDVNIKLDAVGLTISDAIQQCRDLVVSRYLVHHSAAKGRAKPGEQVTSNGISRAFQESCEAAGIKAAEGRTPPTFHEIRSLSQRLYRKEYGAEFAQAMLGHKHASMTEKYDDMRGQEYQLIKAK